MNKTIIIAEAGVNHNGDVELAKLLIDKAAIAGADYVKFQTFKAEDLVTQSSPTAAYQQVNTKNYRTTQYEMLKSLELKHQDYPVLIDHACRRGIKFLSSPFDLDSVEFVYSLGVDMFKIGSGEITNLPLLRKVASYDLPIVLSTGMSTLGEIEAAINVLAAQGASGRISILHCNTEYPTPWEDVNLKAIKTLARAFKVPVGYSDHTEGIEISIAAVALGATIIEKHFTLDRSMIGPDHKASLQPDELALMVKSIRNVELALGEGAKKPSPSELKNIEIARKSIVAKCDIKAGQAFTEINLTTKRPGTGINPMNWDFIVGKIARRDYQKDDLIDL